MISASFWFSPSLTKPEEEWGACAAEAVFRQQWFSFSKRPAQSLQADATLLYEAYRRNIASI